MSAGGAPAGRAALLSKSDFALGCDCPVKLRYRRLGYPARPESNAYLEFFADGGFMVEAIARALRPDGEWIVPAAGEAPEDATRRALRVSGDRSWFEPTFVVDGLLARVDILERRGEAWRLVEVKARSYDSTEGEAPWRGARGGVLSTWREYVMDVAFQTRVLELAMPGARIEPVLCCVDVSRTCREDAIFAQVRLRDDDPGSSGPRAVYEGDVDALRAQHFLGHLPMREAVDAVADEVEARIAALRTIVADPSRPVPAPIGARCRDCEYRDHRYVPSGFRECWGALGDVAPHVIDMVEGHRFDSAGGGIDGRVARGQVDLLAIAPGDFDAAKAAGVRQARQQRCLRAGTDELDPAVFDVLDACPHPLHFIDFETSQLAVPYHAGMRPYEQIAFQFSCHTIATPGSTELRHSEWINVEDAHPSFAFARALRAAIGDGGTVFVWSNYEQNVLRTVRAQMDRYGERDDALAAWLEAAAVDRADGGRVEDLLDLCAAHYYHPAMGASASIKYVLPAVWGAAPALWTDPWFARYYAEGLDGPLDPYAALASARVGEDGDETVEAVRDGIGAMRSYQEMMYGPRRGDAAHREAVRRTLLRYCELDTAAMVIIWKYWCSRRPAR
ncbi:MAG: DUF2779 domain-containing protein [Ilumatobacteraceae bacterium]